MSDDRKCDRRDECKCLRRVEQNVCPHFHLPMPNIRSAYSQHGYVRDLREQGMEHHMNLIGSTEHKDKIKRAEGNFGRK